MATVAAAAVAAAEEDQLEVDEVTFRAGLDGRAS